jgi:hypothetical protein
VNGSSLYTPREDVNSQESSLGQIASLFESQLSDIERNEVFPANITPERRAELWMQQADLGEEEESLVNDCVCWRLATPRMLNETTAIRTTVARNSVRGSNFDQLDVDAVSYARI